MSLEISTYVFLDLETTGLPYQELNRTKITELSMVAVYREHVLETRPGCSPRVQDKLTLCVNPQKLVNPESSDTTGLDNDLLQYKTPFNKEVCCMIRNFLNLQPKPVCLIAQNGMGFDFPILKNHLEKNKEALSEDVMCADCYHGFYDILENKEIIEILPVQDALCSTSSNNSTVTGTQSNALKNKKVKRNLSIVFGNLCTETNMEKSCSEKNHIDNKKESLIPLNELTPTATAADTIIPPNIASEITTDTTLNSLNELDLRASDMKLLNESTPKRQIKYMQRRKSLGEIRNRRYPWASNNQPKKSYKLGAIYERVLNRQAPEAHRAENDCLYALEIAAALGKEFVSWVDDNCCPFSDIKPMTIGVKIGF